MVTKIDIARAAEMRFHTKRVEILLDRSANVVREDVASWRFGPRIDWHLLFINGELLCRRRSPDELLEFIQNYTYQQPTFPVGAR